LLVNSISSNGDSPEAVALHQSLWQGLYGMGKFQRAAAGTVLFREGEPVRGLFLLAGGTVRLSLGKNGKSIIYRLARPKYILGLPATLLHRPYSLTATVEEDAEFYFVDSRVAMDYLRLHADMCMHVLEFLSHEMVWIRHIHAAQLESSRSPVV
jgi:CRP-like cAMP-binding protein